MINQFFVDINGTEYNFKNDLLIDTLSIQARCDTAFATGSCQIITDKISHNIPSNCVCWLDDGLFLITSEAKKHPTINGLYIHSCKLTDITALLETYVLGSKAFSIESGMCQSDNDRIDIILNLVNAKYVIDIMKVDEFDIDYPLGNHEYTFGAGTTLFAALSEIALRNGYRVVISDVGGVGASDIYIDFVDLDIHNYVAFDTSRIIEYKYLQNDDNYCKYLETEAQNVVDRGSTQIWRDLTCRSQGPAIDADNACVVLPSNVEGITEFKVYGDMKVEHLNIDLDSFKSEITVQWMIDNGASLETINNPNYSQGYVITGTFADLKALPNPIHNVMVNLESHLDWASQIATFRLVRLLPNSGDTVYISAITYQQGVPNRYTGNIDVTDRLLEESAWNILGASDKPKYAVYKTGSNKIYNLNATYKYDFWGVILGISSGNYLSYSKDISYDDTISGNTFHVDLVIGTSTDNPVPKVYSVKAIAITKPMVIVQKKDAPYNESTWRESTRTYTNSANTINLDALYEDMYRKVETLGCIEAVALYEGTGLNINTYPKCNEKIKLNDEVFYIFSYEITHKSARTIIQYNLSSKPSKIADAIGVDYQFNPIRLPYYSIIDRPTFFETINTTAYNGIKSAIDNDKSVLLVFKTGIRHFVLRATVMNLESQNAYVLYCECVDNYSCGDYAIYNSANKYENRACPYGDSYNELNYVDIVIYALSQSITTDFSYEMPNILENRVDALSRYAKLALPRKYIYKDGRERLTFTIKINKF